MRSRSCFRVNRNVQIDFGPDAFYQSVVLGNDLTTVTDFLITHTHEDHLALGDLGLREMALEGAERPINLYLSRAGCDWLTRAFRAYVGSVALSERYYRLVPVDYHVPFSVGELTVTPLKGNHRAFGEGEQSVNYLIRLQNGKVLYYALDTGYFLEETFEFLRGASIDFLVVDSTFGDSRDYRRAKTDGHMGCEGVLAVAERLLSQNTLGPDSRVYATHINHKHSLTYDSMRAYYEARRGAVPVFVGYDGMEIAP